MLNGFDKRADYEVIRHEQMFLRKNVTKLRKQDDDVRIMLTAVVSSVLETQVCETRRLKIAVKYTQEDVLRGRSCE